MIERNGFLITGLQLFCLDEVNAEEFFEIYRGVVPEFMVYLFKIFIIFLINTLFLYYVQVIKPILNIIFGVQSKKFITSKE